MTAWWRSTRPPATGKLKWQFAYNPAYIISYSVNRGVGLSGGRVFIATLDCRIIALDAGTGKQVWNVPGCKDPSNNFISMAAHVYKDAIIVGHADGDYGTEGDVRAFSTKDGAALWTWSTQKKDTWPGTSWQHGVAAVWSGLSIDPKTGTLFVGPGNPARTWCSSAARGRTCTEQLAGRSRHQRQGAEGEVLR